MVFYVSESLFILLKTREFGCGLACDKQNRKNENLSSFIASNIYRLYLLRFIIVKFRNLYFKILNERWGKFQF